jgi:hypothetical protein
VALQQRALKHSLCRPRQNVYQEARHLGCSITAFDIAARISSLNSRFPRLGRTHFIYQHHASQGEQQVSLRHLVSCPYSRESTLGSRTIAPYSSDVSEPRRLCAAQSTAAITTTLGACCAPQATVPELPHRTRARPGSTQRRPPRANRTRRVTTPICRQALQREACGPHPGRGRSVVLGAIARPFRGALPVSWIQGVRITASG